MKKLFVLFFMLCGMAVFAQTNPIDGNWKGSRETPNGTFEIEYTFKVEGDKLTGTWKTQFGETKIENGKVKREKSFQMKFKWFKAFKAVQKIKSLNT